jgi:DNA-binding transcriptional regulator/RsmH inhibitor MraZ
MNMSEEKREEGIIKNTGVLDLKSVTEEEVERIKGIENVGVMIVPEKFVGRLSAKTKNVGVVIPYKEGLRLYSGKSTINDETLKSFEEPIGIINAGKLLIEKKTTTELITQKIKEIRNYGKIIVPKHVRGALTSKITENHGKIEVLEEYVQEKIKELQKEIEDLQKMAEG